MVLILGSVAILSMGTPINGYCGMHRFSKEVKGHGWFQAIVKGQCQI